MKNKETLEEFIEEELEGYDERDFSTYERFITLGAKWQAERIGLMEIELNHTKTLLASCEKALENRGNQAKRMYSEEEVLVLLHSRMTYTLGEDYKEVTTIEWFEQFKKK